jgi:hypothetical protein
LWHGGEVRGLARVLARENIAKVTWTQAMVVIAVPRIGCKGKEKLNGQSEVRRKGGRVDNGEVAPKQSMEQNRRGGKSRRKAKIGLRSGCPIYGTIDE